MGASNWTAPCGVCGYSGPGFYQPNTHPCMRHGTLYAALKAEVERLREARLDGFEAGLREAWEAGRVDEATRAMNMAARTPNLVKQFEQRDADVARILMEAQVLLDVENAKRKCAQQEEELLKRILKGGGK